MKQYQVLKTILLSGCILFFLPLITQAQLPEQDCSGAIVITSSPDTFPVYSSFGSTQELTFPYNTTCLIGGEENSVWITFNVCDTGLLLFEISPDGFGDDFDWALYDFTNHTCADVFDTLNQLRCNYSAIPGQTGLDTGFMMISVSSGGPNQCAPLHPYVHQGFLLVVNNHANTFTGFVLTFSGTATLCNTVGVPEIKSDNKFFLYPNPTDGILQLKNLPAKNNLSIEVMNVYGNKVYEKQLKGSADDQLHLSPLLPDGFYLLRILVREDSFGEEAKLLGEESFIISR